MKKLSMALLGLMSLPVMAQSTGIIGQNLDLNTLSKNKILTLETGVSTVRDSAQDFDVAGFSQFYKAETGVKLNASSKVQVGAEYFVREFDDKSSERKNRDHLSEIYLRSTTKLTKFKENGIADVNLQGRIYSGQDQFFKDFYGSDGNYQVRAYYGRPLTGRLSISRHTSYLRYKKYITNDSFGDRSRDHELRARITPTYNLMDGLDLGVTFTYNQITTQNSDYDEENIETDLGLRYQKGKYAILGIASYPYMVTNEDGDLAYNKDAGEDIEYTLILSAYIF